MQGDRRVEKYMRPIDAAIEIACGEVAGVAIYNRAYEAIQQAIRDTEKPLLDDLAANAPTWLQQLLDENERLKAENELSDELRTEAINDLQSAFDRIEHLQAELKLAKFDDAEATDQITQLQADKAVAVKALQWYADQENYEFPEVGDYQVANPPAWDDGGDVARQALERIESGEKG